MNNRCFIALYYSATNELAKLEKSNSSSICQRLMNHSCKKLVGKFGVIYTNLCMHFSTCMIHNFVLKVSHFVLKIHPILSSQFRPQDEVRSCSFCFIHNFVLKVSHFVFKCSSYLELIESYCPVQTRSYLLNKKC